MVPINLPYFIIFLLSSGKTFCDKSMREILWFSIIEYCTLNDGILSYNGVLITQIHVVLCVKRSTNI